MKCLKCGDKLLLSREKNTKFCDWCNMVISRLGHKHGPSKAGEEYCTCGCGAYDTDRCMRDDCPHGCKDLITNSS